MRQPPIELAVDDNSIAIRALENGLDDIAEKVVRFTEQLAWLRAEVREISGAVGTGKGKGRGAGQVARWQAATTGATRLCATARALVDQLGRGAPQSLAATQVVLNQWLADLEARPVDLRCNKWCRVRGSCICLTVVTQPCDFPAQHSGPCICAQCFPLQGMPPAEPGVSDAADMPSTHSERESDGGLPNDRAGGDQSSGAAEAEGHHLETAGDQGGYPANEADS